jgi:hypothetical protein
MHNRLSSSHKYYVHQVSTFETTPEAKISKHLLETVDSSVQVWVTKDLEQ